MIKPPYKESSIAQIQITTKFKVKDLQQCFQQKQSKKKINLEVNFLHK